MIVQWLHNRELLIKCRSSQTNHLVESTENWWVDGKPLGGLEKSFNPMSYSVKTNEV